MAGSKIAMPANGSTDWGDFVTITQHSYRHYQFVSLSNSSGGTTAPPAIEAGSYAVVNGTMYSLTPSTGGNETISTTGLSTGFTEGELWIKSIPTTGTSITSEFTTVEPTWSASKGGYYSTGNDKYLGGVYKTTDNYLKSWVYESGKKIQNGGSTSRPNLLDKYNIGAWNMDADATLTLETICSFDNIIDFHAYIMGDGGVYKYPIDTTGSGSITMYIGSGSIGRILMTRTTGLFFDSTNFNDTSINRGWVSVRYRG